MLLVLLVLVSAFLSRQWPLPVALVSSSIRCSRNLLLVVMSNSGDVNPQLAPCVAATRCAAVANALVPDVSPTHGLTRDTSGHPSNTPCLVNTAQVQPRIPPFTTTATRCGIAILPTPTTTVLHHPMQARSAVPCGTRALRHPALGDGGPRWHTSAQARLQQLMLSAAWRSVNNTFGPPAPPAPTSTSVRCQRVAFTKARRLAAHAVPTPRPHHSTTTSQRRSRR